MKTDNPYNPVNLKEIDDQHVKIINCIEELEHLSEAGQKKHLVIPMIDELVSS